jgi:hypothetical protein
MGLPSNYSIKRTAFRRRLFQALAVKEGVYARPRCRN